jgi:N-acetylglucosaminyldiphosphoundecaprenol N-acetyl-beta-D-mannosaminyltransferase
MHCLIINQNSRMSRINFLSIPVDNLTMDETIDVIDKSINDSRSIAHTVINAGKVVMMQTNKELYDSVVSADLINADGQAIVWGAKLLGQPLKERVAGIDLMQNLVKYAFDKNKKIFFLGAKEEVVSKVVDIYSEKYSKNIIAGFRNGYFDVEQGEDVAKEIAISGADLLFVAITSPKKEIFLNKHREVLKNVGFTMGVGGSFDVVAGLVKRAPLWMQNSGLEWFYRFIQEPKRMWRRYLVGNIKFMLLILKNK